MRVSWWKLLLPLGALVIVATALVSSSVAAPKAKEVRVAIMTDCKGAFASHYEDDIGGAQAAFAKYAGGKPKSKAKPSAGMTGIKAGGTSIKIVGYGCGDDTAPTAIKETRRLMEGLKADVMVGPLSGDEAVAIANYAKGKPTKTFIIGTAASQDPTMQIAPKNLFRYFGDGAQWNAGLGEIVYKKLGWRKAAIIMDDYSFAWTSAAGIIADFCGIGGRITKRVFPPLNTTDYASYVQQLPKPDQVDGYFWVVGGSGTGPSLKAMEQANGKLNPKQLSGNLFLIDGAAAKEVGAAVRRLVRGRVRHRAGSEDGAGDPLRGRSGEGVPVAEGVVGRRLRLQLLQRCVGARPRAVRPRPARPGRGSRRRCPARLRRATRSATRVASSSTAGGRRSRTSTSCRSARAAHHRSSASCRTSPRRSAACSDRTSRRPAGPSHPA